MNPLIISIGMDETVDADKVTLNVINNELFRRHLQIKICSTGNDEYEVWIWGNPESHTLRQKIYAVNASLTEAVIDAMNDHWTEYKQ
jgi:hypothetical protein